MSFHQTIVHGRIGRDIECNYSNNGVAIAKFSVAVSEKYNGEEKTTWYNVTAFKTTAENLAKYFSKGSEIIIIGNMQFGSYDKDGVTRYTSDLIVRSFDFCGSKSDNQSAGQQNYQQPQNNGFQAPPQHSGGKQPMAGGYQQQQTGGYQSPPDDSIQF